MFNVIFRQLLWLQQHTLCTIWANFEILGQTAFSEALILVLDSVNDIFLDAQASLATTPISPSIRWLMLKFRSNPTCTRYFRPRIYGILQLHERVGRHGGGQGGRHGGRRGSRHGGWHEDWWGVIVFGTIKKSPCISMMGPILPQINKRTNY